MQTMSAEMAALLKSGKQIGANRPNHQILLGEGGVEEYSSLNYIRQSEMGVYRYANGRYTNRVDGKLLVSYNRFNEDGTNGKIFLSVVDTEEDLFTVNDSAKANEWELMSLRVNAHQPFCGASLLTVNSKILMFVTDAESDRFNVKVYKSDNGLGTDFVLLYTLVSDVYGIFSPSPELPSLINGVIYYVTNRSNGTWSDGRVFYSEDTGETWDYIDIDYGIRGSIENSVVRFSNGLFGIVNDVNSDAKAHLLYSTDWVNFNISDAISGYVDINSMGGQMFSGDEYNYLLWSPDDINIKIYQKKKTESHPTTLLVDEMVDYWEDTGVVFFNAYYSTFRGSYTTGNKFAIIGDINNSRDVVIYGYEIIAEIIQAKSIQISRIKGMAGQLTVELDNKDGVLAPDGTTNPALLWPNKEVTVKQGYGAELIQTFKGLIDTISMSTFPQSITISARDKMKALLDHYIRDSSFNYVVTYTAQTVEAIWQDLITKAGLTYGTVEATGITLAEKVFSWESYADAISWLDEIAGFETYCDEFGILHFIYDGRPETVTVAYEFNEGVDIISLGYDINDKDLYYSVVVYGKDANDAVVYYAATLPQASYWNIPSGKVMRIDAPDADTQAKCQAIADKAIYLMQTRARQVHFETIGIPHLQRGDFIQVTEASTTISEIYRITDISTSQDSSGYRMELTCYYHAAPEV